MSNVAPLHCLEELKSSLDSLPAQLRERLLGEIRLLLFELSEEQEAGLFEIAS